MENNFDLVDEMMWEDLVDFETLESAGLENTGDYDTVPAAQMMYYREENSPLEYMLDNSDYIA